MQLRSSLYFRDRVEITIYVKAIKIKAIEWGFRIYRLDEDGAKTRAAKGSYTCARLQKQYRPRYDVSRHPREFAQANRGSAR